MEFVDRVCMQDLDPNGFTKDERSNIMVKAKDAESVIAFRGVQHKVFGPRNVVYSGTDLRVVIIDFDVSVVTLLAYSRTPSESHQLPV